VGDFPGEELDVRQPLLALDKMGKVVLTKSRDAIRTEVKDYFSKNCMIVQNGESSETRCDFTNSLE
jgi:hypothetical protein